MNKMSCLQNELSLEIRKFKKVSLARRNLIKKYMTGQASSNLDYLGLSVPSVRALLKKDLAFLNEDLMMQYRVFEKNWFEARTFEQKALSLHWLDLRKPEELQQIAKPLLKWSTIIDNWAHSDGLCGTYAKIFESHSGLYLPVYKKWTKHKNPWLRRISMVGLMYYSRSRRKLPSFKLAQSLVKPHFR